MSGQIYYYDGTAAVGNGSAGTAGQVLTSPGSGGTPTFQNVPAFGSALSFVSYLAAASINNVTGNGTAYSIVFDTTTRNDSSIYDTTTGIFTANKSGIWILTSNIFFNYAANLTAVNVGANSWYQNLTNGQQSFTYFINPYAVQNITQSLFSIGSASTMLLTSGDQIVQKIQVFGSATDDVNITGGSAYYTTFAGTFLGT